MALVDIISLVITLMSALWGLSRGLSRELLGLVSWIAAAILASRWYGYLVPLFQPHVPSYLVADVLAFATTFVVLIGLFSAASIILSRTLRGTVLSGIDRTLGFVFGFLRGGVILSAIYIGGAFFLHADVLRSATEGSRLFPFITQGAELLENFLPVFIRPTLASPEPSRHDRDN